MFHVHCTKRVWCVTADLLVCATPTPTLLLLLAHTYSIIVVQLSVTYHLLCSSFSLVNTYIDTFTSCVVIQRACFCCSCHYISTSLLLGM